MIWDILLYIPDDIKILRRSSFCLVTVCFVTSRWVQYSSQRDETKKITYCQVVCAYVYLGRCH